MKSVNAAVTTAIRQAYNIYCKPRLKAEWNMNRYATPSADNLVNESDYGFDPEYFPIESIYEPNRPSRGICKARIGEARVSEYSEGNVSQRYYVAGVDDLYKYWTSPVQSSGATFPVYNQTFATPYEVTDAGDGRSVVRPYVSYANPKQVNKIVIKLENSFSSPASYQVIIKSVPGDAWTYSAASGTGPGIISTNPTIDGNGQVILYHQGAGVWNTTVPAAGTTAPLTNVAAVMFKVDTMTVSNTYFNLIEISARREEDLTSRLISVEDSSEVSETSFIYPIGTITSNTSTISLSNVDSIFDQDSSGSYAGILEPNVMFTLDWVYTISGTQYVVREFDGMYGGPWSGQKDETVTITCSDYSKFLQETTPLPTFYKDLSVSEIIWRLLDQAGFVNYIVTSDTSNANTKVPIFWTNGEQSLWEIFDELARGTQTAVYFDFNGFLRVKTRTKIYDKTASPVWTIRGEQSGAELPDIVDDGLDQTDEFGSNHITVNYQDTHFTPDQKGFPVMERVWEPDGTVALRASPIVQTFSSSATTVKLSAADAAIWPYKGTMQVEGEIINYDGKQYVYYPANVATTVVLKSQEQKDNYDALTPSGFRYKNHYTGNLMVSERGAWNSEAKAHNVEATGYSVRKLVNGAFLNNSGGFTHQKSESTITLQSGPSQKDLFDYVWITRGTALDSAFTWYGTRVKFNNDARSSQRAGILINNQTSAEDGYYIELCPTRLVDRTINNEIKAFSRVGGITKPISTGVAKAVVESRYYDIDVGLTGNRLRVFLNGVKCIDVTVPAGSQVSSNGKFGLFTRGSTSATFEYLYAVQRTDREPSDGSTFYDKVRGAYASGQWDREWVYKWVKTTKREKKKYNRALKRWNRMFMDEFGPYAHEVREFEVKFEPNPVLHSRLFNSNDSQILCPEYYGQPFGAKFVLVNAARKNAIANGDDGLTAPGNTIGQQLFVFGRAVVIEEAEQVIVKNDAQIIARGKIETEISSQWIQSKNSAEAIGNWIKDHWSIGSDEQTVTLFGNPLYELGDVVTVQYVDRNMTSATHKYFVNSINNDFSDGGLQTVLTLRRVT